MIKLNGALALCALVAATAATTAIVAIPAGPANAADLYGSIKDDYAPMPAARSEPRVYLRIDGGYGEFDKPEMVEDGIYDLFSEEIDGTWVFGGGAGMYFTPSWRGDITVERRFDAEAQGALLNTQTGIDGVRRFDIESTLVMFNLYYDFDPRSRFTPYVGAGIGWVRNETKDGTVELNHPDSSGTIAGATKDGAAGAFMAGVSLALLDRLHLDAGYRFLYLGDATTGPLTVTGGPNGPQTSRDPSVEHIHAHEVKFGLRYDLF